MIFIFLENVNILPPIIILSETLFDENKYHDIEGYNRQHVFRPDKRGEASQ